jgi:uncharacterized Zn finger protein
MGQLQYPCAHCQQNSFHAVVRSRKWMTVFWIPIFPITKATTARCNLCGFQEKLDNKKADELLPQGAPKAANA